MARDGSEVAGRRGPNAERSVHTRQRVVSAANQLLGRAGYAAVSVDDIAAAAGLTKGAVYHHFGSKAGVLEAVVVRVNRRTRQRVARATRRALDARERLLTGCDAYLGAIARPDALAALVFIEAPAVLGWQRWRQLDDQAWRNDLLDAVAGTLPRDDSRVEAVADAVSALLAEASLTIASGADARPVRSKTGRTIGMLLDAVSTSRPMQQH